MNNWKTFIKPGYKSTDLSFSSYKKLESFTKWVFSLAEYLLVFGAFVYLARITESLEITFITSVLGLVLFLYIGTTISGYHFFDLRNTSSLKQKLSLFFVDLVIFILLYFIFKEAFLDVMDVYNSGNGI